MLMRRRRMGLRRNIGPNPTGTSSKLFELHMAPACAADEEHVLGDQRIPFETNEGVISFVQSRVHLVISKKDKYTFPARTIDSTTSSGVDLDCDSLVKFYGLTGYFIFTSILWDTNRLMVEWQEHNLVHDTVAQQWRVLTSTRVQAFSFGEDPRFEIFSIGKSFFVKAKLPEGKVYGATFEFIICKTPPVITA